MQKLSRYFLSLRHQRIANKLYATRVLNEGLVQISALVSKR